MGLKFNDDKWWDFDKLRNWVKSFRGQNPWAYSSKFLLLPGTTDEQGQPQGEWLGAPNRGWRVKRAKPDFTRLVFFGKMGGGKTECTALLGK